MRPDQHDLELEGYDFGEDGAPVRHPGAGNDGEPLRAEHEWFHVVRAMVLRDRIAEMGCYAWATYCVLKSYTAMDTGRAWPSQQQIARHLGLSTDTVMRAIDKLVQLNIITKERVGKNNHYQLLEEVPITNGAGHVVATGRHPYTPVAFHSMMSELKAFAASGKLMPGANVKIEIHVNFIQQGDNSVVNVGLVKVAEDGGSMPATEYEQIAEQLRRIDH